MDGLDPARIAMLTAGSGLIVGCVDPDGTPLAVRAWCAAIVGGRLRIGMSADDVRAVANVEQRAVAITAADVPTLASVQVKGRVVGIEPPTRADLELMASQSEAFFQAIHHTDGYPVEGLRRLLPRAIVMIEIEVSDVFDQSPGPRAGLQLGAPT